MKPCRHGHIDGAMHVPCYQCRAEYWQARAEAAEATQRAEEEPQGWVAVDLRLPIGVEKPLLLYGEKEMLIMGIFNTPDKVFLAWDADSEDWYPFDLRVTHWKVIDIPNGAEGLRIGGPSK